MSSMMQLRVPKGLRHYIGDLRACTTKQSEAARVNQELAKIRHKFSTPYKLTPYDRKKYIFKLAYSHILGYEVNFGGMETVNLINSPKPLDKAAGYTAAGLLLQENDDAERLIVNFLRQDLSSPNMYVVSFALHFVANSGGTEIAENVFHDIQRLANTSNTGVPTYVRKKAYLALLRVFKCDANLFTADIWAIRLAKSIQTEVEVGCLAAICSTVIGVLECDPTGWHPILHSVIQKLQSVSTGDVQNKGFYYGVAAPWLQVKLLRILQYFPLPKDKSLIDTLVEALQLIVKKQIITPKKPKGHGVQRMTKQDNERINRVHVELAVFFEAVNLIIQHGTKLPLSLRQNATLILSGLSASKDSNLRYMGLESLARLATDPEVASFLKKQIERLFVQLNDADVSICRQALSVLYTISDKPNWQFIVEQLLETLKRSENTDFQEDLTLKIAIIVEKHVPNFTWYVDVVFKMIEYAPDCVSDDIWHRLVQVLTGFDYQTADKLETTQAYAAAKAYDFLTDQFANEKMLRLGAYLLGEFGHYIRDEATGKRQLKVVHQHWPQASPSTQALLLTAYAKLYNAHEDARDEILIIMEDNKEAFDVDVQQRAVEYYCLLQSDEDLMQSALSMMPTFSDAVQNNNPLIRRMKQSIDQRGRATTRDVLEESAITKGTLLKASTDFVSTAHIPESSDAEDGEDQEEGSGDQSTTSDSSDSSSADRSSSASEDHSDSADSNDETSDSSNQDSSEKVTTVRALRLPPVDPKNVKGLWKNLCLLNIGPLYDNIPLSVAVRQQYEKCKGQLNVKFVNRSTDMTVIIHRAVIQPENGIEARAQPFKESLLPGQSKIHQISVMLHEPFLNPPRYIVTANVVSQLGAVISNLNLPFSLPITVAKFIVPAAIQINTFQKYWNELAKNEVIYSGTLAPYIDSPATLMSYLTTPGAFNLFGKQVGNTLCGCGSLMVFDKSTQRETVVACMTKIICSPSRSCQILVCSASKVLSDVLLRLLSTYLLTTEQMLQSVNGTAQSNQLQQLQQQQKPLLYARPPPNVSLSQSSVSSAAYSTVNGTYGLNGNTKQPMGQNAPRLASLPAYPAAYAAYGRQ